MGRKARAIWNDARKEGRMAIVVRHPAPRVQPLPQLPLEAGEHDDFARGLAMAPPRAGIRKHAWIGVIALVVFAVCAFDFCVRVPSRWAPVSDEHVLPTR